MLYLENPPGVSAAGRRKMLDRLRELHQIEYDATLDPAIQARIAQYEMAYRMQTSVPEVTRLADEPDHVFDLYGPDSRKPGTFAANCLLARRLAERDVRFIQLYHPGWDHHGGLPARHPPALPRDRPGLRGPDPGPEAAGHARRHPGALGRRVRPDQLQPGEADGHRLRPRPPPPLLHRLGGRRRDQARASPTARPTRSATASPPTASTSTTSTPRSSTCSGIDHERLTYKHQGRYYRLTDVSGNIVRGILA